MKTLLVLGLFFTVPCLAYAGKFTEVYGYPGEASASTLLPNGDVLLTGVSTSWGAEKRALLFHPGDNDRRTPFELLENGMHYYREGNTATLLNNGKVLLVGGAFISARHEDDEGVYFLKEYNSSAELYDPASKTFTEIPGGSIQTRTDPAVTPLQDGRVLIVGGDVDSEGLPTFTNTAEIYDPSSNTFKRAGAPTQDEYFSTATLLPSGKVLMAGGISQDAEIYDPTKDAFSVTGRMPEGTYTAHKTSMAFMLPNGQVLVTGTVFAHLANDNHEPHPFATLYDPEKGTFAPTGAPNTLRSDASGVQLSDGRVLLTGGYQLRGSLKVSSSEIYDAATGQFTMDASLHTGRSNGIATLLKDGRVLVYGGSGENQYPSLPELMTSEIYTP